jgi:hypothetical protein
LTGESVDAVQCAISVLTARASAAALASAAAGRGHGRETQGTVATARTLTTAEQASLVATGVATATTAI